MKKIIVVWLQMVVEGPTLGPIVHSLVSDAQSLMAATAIIVPPRDFQGP
jgi:hypothetical protein